MGNLEVKQKSVMSLRFIFTGGHVLCILLSRRFHSPLDFSKIICLGGVRNIDDSNSRINRADVECTLASGCDLYSLKAYVMLASYM